MSIAGERISESSLEKGVLDEGGGEEGLRIPLSDD